MSQLLNLLAQKQTIIAGEWRSANDGRLSDINNPATGEIIGSVPFCGSAETEQAVEMAHSTHLKWKKTLAKERSQILRRWYELVLSNIDELAQILTLEQGKPLAEAKGEIHYAASFIEWYAEEAKRTYGEIVPSHKSDARILVSHQAIGVVGAITPWNFPAAMITRKCAPAFAAGCAVVLKPAPDTPFTALAFAKLAQQAGIPDGLFSVITGDAVAIGGVLTSHKLVKKISFTGSTPVGKLLMQQASNTVKKVSLELGGNAPFIVFDDADLDKAIEGYMIAKYRNAGQTCVCANRLYIQRGVYDLFLSKLEAKVEQLKMGNGLDAGVTIGPLINRAAAEKVERHIQDAISKGASLVTGSLQSSGNCFVTPAIIRDLHDDMLVAQEETFGPLASAFVFDSEEEVIARANNTDSGLAAYVYTQSLSRAFTMSEALEYGMVGVNEGLISTEVAPFGGIKESGLGREGARQGIDEYMEVKYTLMGGI
ncbi:TPA: NAD-dependent succinate-semialdehyde dehydrogenase [Photobacterium damselae]